MAKIYVSSTYSDLIPHRKVVSDVLRQLGQQVIAMEDYVASDERPLARCQADVRSSDLYVGIFAWRYGFTPPGHDQSITELEYRAAVDQGVPVLLFLTDENAPWPRNQVDRPSARIEAFREELKNSHLVSFFENPEGLATKVSIAVARELMRLGESNPSAVTIRVFNFENYSPQAREVNAGERFPGVVLNQLLKLQLQTKSTESRLLPSNVFSFRSGPPANLVAELRRMAPCIIVSGFIDSGESVSQFHASIRVSSFNNDLESIPLIVEDIEFEDNRASMTSAWGDIAERIWIEAKKLNVQIDRLVVQLDDAQSATEAREQLVALGSLDQVIAYLERQSEPGKILPVLDMLAKLDDPTAVRGLIPLLEAEDEIRYPAARLAARFGYPPALRLVSEELRKKMNTTEALDLLRVIELAYSHVFAPEVEVSVGSSLPEVRMASLRILETQFRKDHTYLLEERLKDDVTEIRQEAARALRAYRRRSLIPIFCQLLDDPDLKYIAACALADVGEDAGAAVLIDDIRRSRSLDDLTESVGLLKELRADSTVTALVKLLKSENPFSRGAAAEILGEFKRQVVIDALGELVDDAEYYPRFMASKALAKIGLPDCLPYLLRFFADPHSNCAKAAFVGYLDLGIFRPEDADAVNTIIRRNMCNEVDFYGSLVLARLGFRDALVYLATLSSTRLWFSAGWERYSYLSRSESFELLKPLTTYDTDALDDWCAWIKSHESHLRWDPERCQFDVA
jgi:HEAT repeat protein